MTKDDIIASLSALFPEKTVGSTPGSDVIGNYDLITIDGADTLVKWRQADVDAIETAHGVDALTQFVAVLKIQLSAPVYEDGGGSMLIHVDFLRWMGERGLTQEEARYLSAYVIWSANADGAFNGLLNQAMGR